MIKLDLATLSIEDLTRLVSERCALHGSVSNISIVRNSTPYAMASVTMQSKKDLEAVNRNLGELLVDDRVLIRIEQDSPE